MKNQTLNIALCQIAPVWLDKKATIDKVITYLEKVAKNDADLAVFGECILPGYPFWLELTGGAVFNSNIQKEIYAHYLRESVQIQNGDLAPICAIAAQHQIAIYLGCLERGVDRANHTVYCTLVYIDQQGQIQSTHRKLMPTYEERLVWGIGDGHGLRVHALKDFHVGGLNCWENWMPLTRASMFAQGENLHVAVWPGNYRNTQDITRHIAKESRSFVVSVSGVMTRSDIGDKVPHADLIKDKAPETLADGGSCIAGPDGQWVVEPFMEQEALVQATVDLQKVLEERQNFDPSGHYSRPDVMKLEVDRRRQKIAEFDD